MMRRYPAYKDSGVEWLGEVPDGWEVKRLGALFEQVDEPGSDDLPILSVSIHSGVSDDEIGPDNLERKVTRSDDRTKYKTVRDRDLVYNMMRAWQGGFGTVTVDGMVSPAYVVARPRKDQRFITNYVENVLRTPPAVEEMRRHSQGVTDFRLRLYWDEFKSIRVPLPPLPEQTAIATFLDWETAKIDALVAEQRRLIDLLREKRQAVISHAVTKGLNPNAPLKPSGIDWLGNVPEGWTVCGIKFFCTRITDGAHISPDTENGAFPFVSTKDVSEDGIDFANCLKTSDTTYQYMVATGCQPVRGDILFSKDGTIGRTVIVATDVEFVVASSLIIIRPDKSQCSTAFLNYLCQSSVVSNQVASFVKGAGLPRLSITNLLKVVGVFPSREEQVVIATHLDKETAKLDSRSGASQACRPQSHRTLAPSRRQCGDPRVSVRACARMSDDTLCGRDDIRAAAHQRWHGRGRVKPLVPCIAGRGILGGEPVSLAGGCRTSDG